MSETSNAPVERTLVQRLGEIFGTADSTASWFLDRVKRGIVVIRDGRTNVTGLDPEKVEEDDERFAMVPAITTADDYEWMLDFVTELDQPRITGLLDAKRGANARFLKRLGKHHTDVLAQWEAYRVAQLEELAREWMAGLDVSAE